MPTPIDILIRSQSQLQGLDAATQKLGQVTGAVGKLQSALNSIALGIGIDIGRRITAAFAAVPAAIDRAVRAGVQFNATLESAELGIAAVIRSFQPGRFNTFDAALIASKAVVEDLQRKAVKTSATFDDLVSTYQGIAGAAFAANIPLEKQADLMVLLSQAISGADKGIVGGQILQEARALITGDINADARVANNLLITREQVRAAREAGRLFEFLEERLKSFAEAGELAGKTFNGAFSNLGDAAQQALGVLTRGVFERLRQAALDAGDAIVKLAKDGTIQNVGNAITDAFSVIETAFRNGRLSDLIVLSVQVALQEGFRLGVEGLRRLLGLIFTVDVVILAAKAGRSVAEVTLGAIKVAIDLVGTLVVITSNKWANSMQKVVEVLSVGFTNLTNYLGRQLTRLLNSVIEKVNTISLLLKGEEILAPLTFTPVESYSGKFSEEKSFADTFVQMQKDSEESRRTILRYLDQQIEATEQILRSSNGLLEADEEVVTAKEKLNALLAEERSKREQLALSARSGAGGGGVGGKDKPPEAPPKPFIEDFDEQFSVFLKNLSTQATLAAGIIQGTLGNAINGVSFGITGLITGTHTWADAMQQTKNAIIGALVNIGVQMVAQFALSQALQAASALTATSTGASIFGAMMPAALATGAATYGIGTVAGIALTIAAMVAAIAAFSGGFYEGGMVPGAPASRDNRIAAVASGEFITNSKAVSYYGPELFSALNSMKMPRGSIAGMRAPVRPSSSLTFATGGLVGPAALGGGAPQVNVEPAPVHFYVLRDPNELQAAMEAHSGQKLLYRMVDKVMLNLGVKR